MAKSVYLISEAAKEVCVENHVLRYWEEELALPVKRNSQGHRYYTMEDLNTFKRIKYLKEQGLQLKAIKLFLSKDGRLITYRPKEELPEDGGQKEISEEKSGKVPFVIHQGDKVTAFCKETSQRSAAGQYSAVPDDAESDAPLPDEEKQEKSMKLVIDKEGSISAAQYDKDKEQVQQEERSEKARKLQLILKLMIEEALREYDSDLKVGLKEEISEKLCADVKDAVIKEMDYQFRMQEEREEKRGQDREERDRELLRRIEEILNAKKPAKSDKTEKAAKMGKADKTERTARIEKESKIGKETAVETEAKIGKEAEIESEAKIEKEVTTKEETKTGKAEQPEKTKQKKQGILWWKPKNSF